MSRFSSQRGFTLVEMLVVIAILAMLSAMVVVNFRETEKQNAVRLGTEQFVGALREAQNYALAQKRVGNPSAVPAGGFGVHVKKMQPPFVNYTLFADTDGSTDYDAAEDITIRPETLPRYSQLTHFRVGETEVDELSIIFRPPQGEVVFGDLNGQVLPDYSQASFVIQSTDPDLASGKEVIVVQATALIDIKNLMLQPQ